MVCGTGPCGSSGAAGSSRRRRGSAARAELRHAIERILAPLGRRADEAEPLADARLPDGSRVHVVLPPLAPDGPVLTIRRFRPRGFAPGGPGRRGHARRAAGSSSSGGPCAARCTVLICGGTGSGKTTTLGALAAFIDPRERIVTIEDAAELKLALPHVVRLEARPPNLEGRGEVTIRRLVRNALRMRPDRLVVGEVRGPEALDLLLAMGTGHAGSLCTLHAGSAAEALRRLETLALMADVGLPLAAIREQVADAIDLVVRQERGADGVRRVVEVAEVVRVAGGPAVRELFAHRDGRPTWRAPLGESRVAAAAAAPPVPLPSPHAATVPAASHRLRGVGRLRELGRRRYRPALVPPAQGGAVSGAAVLAAGAAGAGVVGAWEALAAVERTRLAAAAGRVLEPLHRAGGRGGSPPPRSVGGSRRSRPRACSRPAGSPVDRGSAHSRRSPGRPRSSWRCARGGAAGGRSCGTPRPPARGRWPTRSGPGRSIRTAVGDAAPAAEGAAGHELAAAARALELGAPTESVLLALRDRARTARLGHAGRGRPPPARRRRRPRGAPPRARRVGRGRGPRRAGRPGRDRPGPLHRLARARRCRPPARSSPSSSRPGFAASLIANPLSATLAALALLLAVAALAAIARLGVAR